MAARRTYGGGSVFYDGRRWVARIEAGWNPNGTRRRITVTGKTEAIVKAKLKAKQREIAKDGLPVAGMNSRTTVKTWSDAWWERRLKEKLSPDTINADRTGIQKWIIPTIGQRRLEDVSPADIRAVQDAQANTGLAASSIERTHFLLMKLLKDAVLEGYSVPQRSREVPGPGRNSTGRAAMPPTDALAVLKAARALPDYSRWVAAILQGLRPAEALGLTWDMIDFDTGTLTVAWQLKALPYNVPRDPSSGFRVARDYEAVQVAGTLHLVRPKSKAGWRRQPLTPWLERSLLEWRQIAPQSPMGIVWPRADGRPRDDKKDGAEWNMLVENADAWVYPDSGPRRRPFRYEARHTTATLLRAAKVDDTTITAIMGHSTILSTQAYLHTDIDRAREALTTIGNQLGLTPTPLQIEA